MGILLLFVIGGVFGYVSNYCRPVTPPRPQLDVAIAIMAALTGGLFLATRMGLPSPGWGRPDPRSILVASAVALIAVLVLYGVRRASQPSTR
jgi:hypothetical protein